MSGPNLQRLPPRTEEGRELERAFAPSKMFITTTDYATIEMCAAADIAAAKPSPPDGYDNRKGRRARSSKRGPRGVW